MHIQKFFRDAPTGTRLLLASTVSQVLLLVLLLGNSMRLLENAARHNLENLIVQNAGLLHAMTAPHFDRPGFGSLQNALGELLARAEDGLIYVRVGDAAGNILLSAGLPGQETLHPPDVTTTTSGGEIAPHLLDRPLIHVRRPLPLPRAETGFLQFGISNAGLSATRRSVIREGVPLALTLILATFALFLAIGRKPYDRLSRILAGCEAMAGGKPESHLPDEGNDALARLARHVNTLRNELRDLAERLATSNDRVALTLAGANDGLWTWDIAGDHGRFSPRFCEIFGLPLDAPTSASSLQEMPSTFFTARLHPDEAATFHDRLVEHLKGATPYFTFEHRIRHNDGSYRWIMTHGIAGRDERGRAVRMAGSVSDIHKCKCVEQQRQYDAMHDPLTGLPNQSLFIEHLQQALARRGRDAHFRCVVLAANLERFHLINDSYSHTAGDHLLRHVAEHFVRNLRSGDIAARLSADQFAILLHDITSIDEARDIARDLLRLPDFTAPGERQALHLTCRGGLASSDDDDTDAATLLRDADSALQAARSSESETIQVFQTAMHTHMLTTLTLETELRGALAEKTLTVAYQPIVRLFDCGIASFEALVRWQHPRRGPIPPGVFIPLAESLDLIHELGVFVLHRACLDILQWQRQADTESPPVSVNLSARQLMRASLAPELLSIIADHGLTPRHLRFEVTESLLTRADGPNIETLHQLREAGIAVLIDDFGTGYSALSYLHTLPCNIIKLDGSFIGAVATDEHLRAIVRHSIGLAHDLGMAVVAECIEKEDQLQMLRAIGCDFGQGYLFSKPVPADEASLLLQRRKENSA